MVGATNVKAELNRLIIYNRVGNPQLVSWFMAGCLLHGWFRAIRSSKSTNLGAIAGAEDEHSFTTASLGQQDMLWLAPRYLFQARSSINVDVEFV